MVLSLFLDLGLSCGVIAAAWLLLSGMGGLELFGRKQRNSKETGVLRR